ncbi:MAG: double-strand break repair protein AddB [Alphaproteobacteria bacterium]|nr:double-strand break repair protein AddB [Alphaproteobacteria bacterium]
MAQPDLFAQSDDPLFAGSAPRVCATASSTPFLDALVDAACRALDADARPDALMDALILVPNRRAVHALVDAFAARLGGAALLPAIRPLGDLGDEPDVWGDLAAQGAPAAIDPMRRRLELARLVRARDQAEGGVDDPVRALALADELCALMDSEASGEAVDWSRLRGLVSERAFAAHWERSAAFLDIIGAYWPRRLAEGGVMDPAQARSARLLSLAARWRAKPPSHPVIVAGSTGSIVATRVLMTVVARLPRGVVALPGLDVDLDERSWRAADAQHPQHALRETLKALGVARGDVRMLGGAADGDAAARGVLIREALAPAVTTADWRARLSEAGGPALAARGAQGLTLVEADNENAEAAAIALLLRQALEDGVSAALATPDAQLARRVAAKLARWGVQPEMSQGRLLSETPIGILLALAHALALDEACPVALLGLAKHPLTAFGREEIAALEHTLLRGPRRHRSLADLPDLATSSLHGVIDRLGAATAPLRALAGTERVSLGAAADAAAACVEAAARDGARVWSGVDGAAAARFIRTLIDHGDEIGALAPREAIRGFAALLAEQQTPPERGGDPRVAILGPLEARLSGRTLMILGGLNEGQWPSAPREGAFLSRPMRDAIGLASPDVRLGLAAHDFAQLANAPRVVLTRALRREGAPTVASRWVWRLKTLLRAAESEHLLDPTAENDPRAWAIALDRPQAVKRAAPPRPRLGAATFGRLSVTQVETLVRDPYAFYARRVLGLRKLDGVGIPPGYNVRGTAIHKAIERLDDAADAAALEALVEEELASWGFAPERRAAIHARARRAYVAFVEWMAARAQIVRSVHLEKKGELPLAAGALLTCKADRIDILPDGRATIVDYKTGTPPSHDQVRTGLAPQLLLEAAMTAHGVIETAPAAAAESLVYWRFGGAEPGAFVVDLKEDASIAAQAALANLEALLQRYRLGDSFLSKPHVQFLYRYGDYDQLARRSEWADQGEEE